MEKGHVTVDEQESWLLCQTDVSRRACSACVHACTRWPCHLVTPCTHLQQGHRSPAHP